MNNSSQLGKTRLEEIAKTLRSGAVGDGLDYAERGPAVASPTRWNLGEFCVVRLPGEP
jgi:hypothetical protein